MERIIPVRKGSLTYALLFCGVDAKGTVRFLTDSQEEFQVGVMERPAGYSVKPHAHPRGEKTITGLSEFLYIERGSVRATVFDDAWTVLAEETLRPGDFLLFLRGGHSIEVLEDCRMIEVKQGPFLGDAAAKTFRPAP